jgi:hypothetical protein
MRSIPTLLLLGMIVLPLQSFAAGLCCQLSSGVQESIAGVAAPASEEVSMQFTYSFTRMDQLQQGTTAISLDDAIASSGYTSIPVSMDMIKYTLTAGYGFSPRFKGFISLPYLRNTMDMIMSNGVGLGWMDMTMEPVSAPGDAVVMGLYRIYTDQDIHPSRALTAGLGIKTATGSSTETTSSGNYVHAHMQPGTGSWDPLVSLLFTQMMDLFLLQADITHQFTTRNRQGYEFGDSTAVNLGATYSVVREFNVSAGLTYLHLGRASDRDGKYTNMSSLMDDPANTGGDSLWFSPGIQVLPINNASVDLKMQLPIWERVNGIQLVTSYRLVMGVSYRF